MNYFYLLHDIEIDPEMIEELRKDRATLIREELDLLKIVSEENIEHYKSLTVDAKKSSSQYKKEVENCNIGVRTCEEARERAQEELVEECKLTALWQKRAEMLAKP
ncbi:DUF1068 domain-containing protein [Cucumis melo var. makuwa]|uniref:DUF1068 domain-containing protein n=2 Tax=Cucumis melo TaxID=3656 RepID=A0A5D3CE23_CUCMM|nr:DUF1068 domain-containing protein [Cucumis melo var. makuwa]